MVDKSYADLLFYLVSPAMKAYRSPTPNEDAPMSLHHPLSVENITILRVAAADVREESIHATGQELFRIADSLGHSRLMIDMADVDFLTSTALGKLVTLNTRMRATGNDLILANVQDDVYEIFEVTRLTKLLDIRRASDGQATSVALAS